MIYLESEDTLKWIIYLYCRAARLVLNIPFFRFYYVQSMHPHYWTRIPTRITQWKKMFAHLQSVPILQHQFQLKFLMSFVYALWISTCTLFPQLWYINFVQNNFFPHRHHVFPVDELNKNRLCPFRFFAILLTSISKKSIKNAFI